MPWDRSEITMQRYYILEGVLILLGLTILVTAIKYPRDIFVKTPIAIIKHVFKEILGWILLPFTLIAIPILYLGTKFNWKITPTIEKLLDFGASKGDKPHASTSNLKVDFKNGDKYVFVIKSKKNLKELINDLLKVLTGKHSIDDFRIADNDDKKIINFPKDINFYDFHLLVQHLNNELGDKNSFGIYKSDELHYYVFHDNETMNNLVGFTSDKRYFSIYMLEDLDKKQHLRLNQKLKVNTEWIERQTARLPILQYNQWRGVV